MQRALVRPLTLAVAVLAAPVTAAMAQRDTVTGTASIPIHPWAVALGINALQVNLSTERSGTGVELFASLSRHTKLRRDFAGA